MGSVVTDWRSAICSLGEQFQLVGSNLMALSTISLAQLPAPGELASGTADGTGGFDDPSRSLRRPASRGPAASC